jgi:hypothetical protein
VNGQKITKGNVAAVPGVNIKDDQAAVRPGPNADIGSGPLRPPSLNGLAVRRGVILPVLRAGVLGGGTAIGFAAGAPAVLNRVQRQDGPAPRGIIESAGQERVHGRPPVFAASMKRCTSATS